MIVDTQLENCLVRMCGNMWILCVLGVIVLFAFGFMIWCLCAAGPKDTLDHQLECLKAEYAKQQRKKIRVKVDGRYY